MDASGENYAGLIVKIDEFIRKYYLNKIVRGSLYLVAALLTGYICVTISEYYGNFSPLIRAVFFYSFILLQVSVFLLFLFKPLLGYLRLGKRIDHHQASIIIGKHFPDVRDKLVNALQLKELADRSPESSAILDSAINQKIAELKPIPFQSAIRLKENRKYLRYSLPPLFVIILLAVTAPYILSEGTERIIHYRKPYAKKAPFKFILLDADRRATQGEDFSLRVKLVGNEVPDEVYLEDGLNTFKIEKENIVSFKHTFKNIQETKSIRFKGAEYFSEPFVIKVRQRPALVTAAVDLIFPKYLNRKTERRNSLSDLTVPAGTRLLYHLVAEHTSGLEVKQEDGTRSNLRRTKDSGYHFALTARKSTNLQFLSKDTDIKDASLVNFRINVTPDEVPSIRIIKRKDSLDSQMAFIIGQINDDHGFTDLKLMYRIHEGSKLFPLRSKAIAIEGGSIQQSFFQSVTAADLKLESGQDLEFYFEVRDNDAVGGLKSARTEVMRIARPSLNLVAKQVEQSQRITETKLKQAIKDAAAIESEAKRLNKDLINEKELSYSQKQQVADVLQKQKDLEQLIRETREESQKSRMNQKDLYKDAESVMEKQQQLEKLLDKVLDDKTRALLKDIEKMLQENQKNETQQEMSRMQAGSRDLQQELDRILELYKQLEFEQKLTQALYDLKAMAREQKKLAGDLAKDPGNKEQTLQRQQSLSENFSGIQKNLASLEEKNRELERSRPFDQLTEKQKAVNNAQKQSERSIGNADMSRAQKEMNLAAAGMEELVSSLEKSKENSQAAENKVKVRTLNQILDNLLKSSFDQEKLLQSVKTSQPNDPLFASYTNRQMQIKDNMKTVGDSLYSLSRVLPQMESTVKMEVGNAGSSINSALEGLAERRLNEAVQYQRSAMTSMNNLTLMIGEVREQLEKAMNSSSGQGKGQQKSISQLIQQQMELNKNMQSAREQLKQKGQQNGKQQDGSAVSEKMVRLAREQNLIKRELEDFTKMLMSEGIKELGNLQGLIKDMEQTEADLVNKRIQLETMNRQQNILARLLQADKSDRERELDDKRESRQGADFRPGATPLLQQLKEIKARETDYLKTVPPGLNSFYQLKVGKYFRSLTSKQ